MPIKGIKDKKNSEIKKRNIENKNKFSWFIDEILKIINKPKKYKLGV